MESRSGERYASKITKERKADVTKIEGKEDKDGKRDKGRKKWGKRDWTERQMGRRTKRRNIEGKTTETRTKTNEN